MKPADDENAKAAELAEEAEKLWPRMFPEADLGQTEQSENTAETADDLAGPAP